METENIRINVTLPKALIKVVDAISGPRKRSAFIADAIRLKVRQERQAELEKQLAEGYQACQTESIEIATEFEPVDLEGWDGKY